MQWRVFNEPRTEIKTCVAKLNHTVWYFSYPKSLLYGIQNFIVLRQNKAKNGLLGPRIAFFNLLEHVSENKFQKLYLPEENPAPIRLEISLKLTFLAASSRAEIDNMKMLELMLFFSRNIRNAVYQKLEVRDVQIYSFDKLTDAE